MYAIGDVCRILSVKPHVLRYWEQEIPILSPRKDHRGNRIYSEGDLNLLFRIRYLLYEKRYTIEGAREELWRRTRDGAGDPLMTLSLVRADLVSALFLLSSWNERFDEAAIPLYETGARSMKRVENDCDGRQI